MGCGASKSNNYRDKNFNSNQQPDNPQKILENEREEQKENILSDSMQQRNMDAQKQNYQEQTNYPSQQFNSMKINNYEMQLIPQIKCHIHKTEDIKGINISINVKQKIYCYKCIIDHKYNIEDLIDIEDIFNTQQNQRFSQLWPIFQNTINKQFAIDSLNNNDPFYVIIQEKFFNIKKQILNYIETYFEQVELRFKNIQQKKNEIKKQFQSMDYQQQIKDILQQNNKQTNELEKQIADLMNKQSKQQTSFEKQIEDYQQNINEEIRKSDDLMKSFKQKFLQFSNEQQFFSENDLSQLQKCQNDQEVKLQKGQELIQLDATHIVNTYGEFQISLINNKKYIHLKSSGNNQSYLNIDILFDQKLEFQIQIMRKQPNQGILVGLANLNLIQKKESFLSNIIFYDGNKHKVWADKAKSIKNKLIRDDTQILNKDISIQVYLKDKIFRWKYNNNINCPIQVDCNPNYPLYLFMNSHDNDIEITIKSMKKVSVFEQWL